MGKVCKIQRSRKEHKCSKCGAVIEVGSPYLKGELNFHAPIVRCVKCGLQSWEVTSSDYLLSVGKVINCWQEDYSADESGVESIVSDLESIRDELQDRLDNMPESLQNADTGTVLSDRIDSIDSVISDLENIDCDADEDESEEDKEGRIAEEIDSALGNIEL